MLTTRKTAAEEQPSNPMSTGFILALFGSLCMFAEALALIALDTTGNISIDLGAAQVVGLSLFFTGCVLHAWSVSVRGRYAVTWAMYTDQKLITVAPYSIVRHPSYLAYMLMIIGVTLIWQLWFPLLPWIAILGYVMVSKREEKLLLDHFGDEYRRYMEKVGAFIPRI